MTKELYEAIRSWTASVENYLERHGYEATDEQKKILKQIQGFGVDIRLRCAEAGKFHQLPKGDFLDWTQTPPSQSGDYWWWNGDEDSRPILVSIGISLPSGECFAQIGQYGWNQAQPVTQMGGYWMLEEGPELPAADNRLRS